MPKNNRIKNAFFNALSMVSVSFSPRELLRTAIIPWMTRTEEMIKRHTLTKRGNILGEKARVCSGNWYVRTKNTAERNAKKTPMIISVLPMLPAITR